MQQQPYDVPTRTFMNWPCALELATLTVVPVFGTFTLYQPG